MKMKRAVMMAVLVLAVAALAVPMLGFKARAASSAADARASLTATKANAAVVTSAAAPVQPNIVAAASQAPSGAISPETLNALGIRRVPKAKLAQVQARAAQKVASAIGGRATTLPPGGKYSVSGQQAHVQGPPLVGQPVVLNVNDALSAALITTIGGRDTQFSEVALIADWDGREDCAADRGTKIDDFSGVEPDIDFSLTRAAISEHTRGNGHPFFNVY
jgi:hypothetical protein